MFARLLGQSQKTVKKQGGGPSSSSSLSKQPPPHSTRVYYCNVQPRAKGFTPVNKAHRRRLDQHALNKRRSGGKRVSGEADDVDSHVDNTALQTHRLFLSDS